MLSLPDSCIPLTVTSPPYDNVRDYGKHEFQFQRISGQLYRITCEGGVVAWVVQEAIHNGSETGSSSEQRLFFRDIGFRLHETIIIVQHSYRYPSQVRYPQQFQYAFILSRGKPRTVNLLEDKPNKCAGQPVRKSVRLANGDRWTRVIKDRITAPYGKRGNVWTYTVGGGSSTKDKCATNHPAIMPELLAEDLILSYSRPGNLVFDPTCGAATTCKMALLNHRKYLGMEIHEPYWRIAEERMGLAHQQHRERLEQLFLNTDTVSV